MSDVQKISGKNYETIDGQLYVQRKIMDLDGDHEAEIGLVPVERMVKYAMGDYPHIASGDNRGYLRYSTDPETLVEVTFNQTNFKNRHTFLEDRASLKK